jgi:hypothetical protein
MGPFFSLLLNLFRLLLSSDAAVAVCIYAMTFVGPVNLDRFQRWLWSTPQEQQRIVHENPTLSEQGEAFFGLFQHHMDTQYQVSALRRQMLTLPGRPDEGY